MVFNVCYKIKRLKRTNAERYYLKSQNFNSLQKLRKKTFESYQKNNLSYNESDNELILRKEQLCKKIATLDYVNSLEFNPKALKDSGQLIEMELLKQKLKADIIKITSNIKLYSKAI